MSGPPRKRLRADEQTEAPTTDRPDALSDETSDGASSQHSITSSKLVGTAGRAGSAQMNKLIDKSKAATSTEVSRSVGASPRSVPAKVLEAADASLTMEEINEMLVTLMDRKKQLERTEKDLETSLFAKFLTDTKAQKEEVGVVQHILRPMKWLLIQLDAADCSTGDADVDADFPTSLVRFSKYSQFQTVATLHYAENLFNAASSIVSSLEFDKDDEFFATAGVMKKIKIFDFGNVVSDYREQGLNLPTPRRSVRDGQSSGRSIVRTTRSLRGGRSTRRTPVADNEDPNEAQSGDQRRGAVGDGVPRYPILEMTCNSKISCLSWNSYIKSYLVASDYEGIITLWDSAAGTPVMHFEEHDKRAWSVDFSSVDPMRFASGGDDTQVKIWSTNQQRSVSTIESRANVCSVKFNPLVAHQLAFGSADHHVHYYDLRNPSTPLHIFKGHRKAVSYVRFLTSDQVVSASTDSTLRLWSLRSAMSNESVGCVRTYQGHTNEKNFVGLSINSDADFLACGSETNEVYAYYARLPKPVVVHKFGNNVDSISGEEVPAEDPTQFVSSVCWKRNSSNTLIAANSQGRVKVMEMV
ncbi:coatomer subunit alpha [Rhizophlyctis rosea]|nr:coatomer subunit alpha [Rhizophlyctis rosea]